MSQQDYELTAPPNDCVSSVAWSPRGCAKTLVGCTSWDGSARVWELQVNLDNNGVAVGLNSQPLCCTNANAPQLGMSFSA